MKKVLKIIGIILLCLVLLVGSYVAYVFISYQRIGDMEIAPDGCDNAITETDKEYKVISYNIGFGAYEPDYSFFMDGGTESWAKSKEELIDNINNISSFLVSENADFYCLQEVDSDSTRTYHVDEKSMLAESFPTYSSVDVQCWKCPFLMYPLTKPHGANNTYLLTMSRYDIEKANRVELPVEYGFTKIFDYDRCYSKSYIKTDNDKYFVLYNLHLSAYTTDGKIADTQVDMLLSDMQNEYDKGNYCVAGGDFNKDLVGDSPKLYTDTDEQYSWTQNIKMESFDGYNCKLVAPFDEKMAIPSCRNTDKPLDECTLFINVDGFVVTDNVDVKESNVINTNFAYSDHNPVYLNFKLKK